MRPGSSIFINAVPATEGAATGRLLRQRKGRNSHAAFEKEALLGSIEARTWRLAPIEHVWFPDGNARHRIGTGAMATKGILQARYLTRTA
ncbi:hypothetical protein [Cellulomonas aerilata]|uniref:Uncharacterized protein n=1 Tax=Cellulomonas aerilata TaxID=515326 RepID=A0A512DEQ3_9CELL|nr:hypothetical protein [Cellulomonas aerilata]GEO34957.1 hypothetical protein CAE01nite_26820 [Cellulomonas aerilata]